MGQELSTATSNCCKAFNFGEEETEIQVIHYTDGSDIVNKDDLLKNFNEAGDDRDPLTDVQIKNMDLFQQFEHRFPFYLMDVNGFKLRLHQAMEL